MGIQRRGRTERETYIINNDFVNYHGSLLTPRDIEMLKLLAKYPFLSSRHLYTMTPQTTEKAFVQIKNGQQRCNERIRLLFDKYFVYKFSPLLPKGKGTSIQYVMLDRAGCKLLGVKKRLTYYDGITLPRHFYHTNAVLDVIAKLYEAHMRREISILFLEYEYTMEGTELRPDILVAYKKGNKGHFLWIEVDRGEKSLVAEEKKVTRIAELKGVKVATESFFQLLGVRVFPRIQYITHQAPMKRTEQLQHLLQTHKLEGNATTFGEWRI